MTPLPRHAFPDDVLANPNLLRGLKPCEIEEMLAGARGWEVEKRRPSWAGAVLESLKPALWSFCGDPMRETDHSDHEQALLEQLIVTVSRLARPAEGQMSYLKSLAVNPSADELALELDDVRDAALVALSAEQQRCIKKLDDELLAMSESGDPQVWTFESLARSDAWSRVRVLAREALATLHSESAISA